MKIISAIRRHFKLNKNEEAAIDFLGSVLGIQFIALLAEGVGPDRVSRMILDSKVVKGYFIGLAWQANDAYKFGDFEYVLTLVGHSLRKTLRSKYKIFGETRNANFVEVLVHSFNTDRRNMDIEFEKGLEMATADGKFYLDHQRLESTRDGSLPPVKITGSEFSFFKYVKSYVDRMSDNLSTY